MSFSNSSGGGTLALPSPTHAHQMDVTSAVRSLRRSISRSPSKFMVRTNSQSSDGSRQGSPSPQPPFRHAISTPHLQSQLHSQSPSRIQSAPPAAGVVRPTTPHQMPPQRLSHPHSQPQRQSQTASQSPTLTPFRPSVRLSLRSVKSSKTSTPSRPLARSRASPKSPLRRPLYNATDSGNLSQSTTATTLRGLFLGQENNKPIPRSPSTRRNVDKATRHSFHLDVSGASELNHLKALDPDSDSYMISTTGALKRSDATMNLDHPNQGSPVAKRRSLHGASSLEHSDDLNIFGINKMGSQGFDIHEDANLEYELTGNIAASQFDGCASPSPVSNLPKRSSSLRKSTLQQRHGDKGSFGRRTGERHLAQMNAESSTPVRLRPRLSTEHFIPPPEPRESYFSLGGPLSFNSQPPVESKPHQPHPLSKALSTSSSGGSLTEETPLYVPAKHIIERPKPHPFSRSLPLNASRPSARPGAELPKLVATPNHKSELWIGAFNSTGLVSKMNRNPEEEADKRIAPPDTPCKKHSNPFATFPPPVGSAIKKQGNNRNSFGGLPSTPFNPSLGHVPDTFGNPAKGLSIFQRGSALRGSRRGSILSQEGDEQKLFSELMDSSNVLDGDIPPTPTKNITPSLSNLSEQSLESPSANRTIPPPVSAVRPVVSRENTASPVDGRRTPQTPQEGLLPLDTSRLSISYANDGLGDQGMLPPVTPTTVKDFRSSTSILVTPVNGRTNNTDLDASLCSKFDKVEQVGKGEFSTVYRVTKFDQQPPFNPTSTTPQSERGGSPSRGVVYAVKKSKNPYLGQRDRDNKMREVQILKALSHAEHVVQYVDDWEHAYHLYIQTEFCEEGTLDKFLGNVGRTGRLDDFRIFKILLDLCLGLKEIHDAGFMHLDMKPANILITFEGALKIGDFGLAQPCPLIGGVDIEGDREYMAPEVLKGRAAQSADVFSLGLMTLEVAANVVLPDNGPTWIALRSGDLSEVPSLTWTPSSEVHNESAHSGGLGSGNSHDASNLFGSLKRSELQQAPDFMVNAYDTSSLDSIVKWMTSQEPHDRPHVDQILDLEGLKWISEHRNAPATIYEGNWGPAEIFPVSVALDHDTEMTDV